MDGFARIVDELTKGQNFMKTGDFQSAADTLKKLWQTKKKDPLVAQFESAITSWLAECYFALGSVDEALNVALTAHKLCKENNDTNGVWKFHRSLLTLQTVEVLLTLHEIYRYKEDKQKANSTASELSSLYRSQNKSKEQKEWEHRAQKVLEGEPLNRVVVRTHEKIVEVEGKQQCCVIIYIKTLNRKTLLETLKLTSVETRWH